MSKPEANYVEVGTGGTAYVGADAVNLMRARMLASSLTLYAKTGMVPTRGVTATKMLALAKQYTGKTYKRGQHLQAAEDVRKWAATMQLALPVINREDKPE